jgi:hypothetical protein
MFYACASLNNNNNNKELIMPVDPAVDSSPESLTAMKPESLQENHNDEALAIHRLKEKIDTLMDDLIESGYDEDDSLESENGSLESEDELLQHQTEHDLLALIDNFLLLCPTEYPQYYLEAATIRKKEAHNFAAIKGTLYYLALKLSYDSPIPFPEDFLETWLLYANAYGDETEDEGQYMIANCLMALLYYANGEYSLALEFMDSLITLAIFSDLIAKELSGVKNRLWFIFSDIYCRNENYTAATNLLVNECDDEQELLGYFNLLLQLKPTIASSMYFERGVLHSANHQYRLGWLDFMHYFALSYSYTPSLSLEGSASVANLGLFLNIESKIREYLDGSELTEEEKIVAHCTLGFILRLKGTHERRADCFSQAIKHFEQSIEFELFDTTISDKIRHYLFLVMMELCLANKKYHDVLMYAEKIKLTKIFSPFQQDTFYYLKASALFKFYQTKEDLDKVSSTVTEAIAYPFETMGCPRSPKTLLERYCLRVKATYELIKLTKSERRLNMLWFGLGNDIRQMKELRPDVVIDLTKENLDLVCQADRQEKLILDIAKIFDNAYLKNPVRLRTIAILSRASLNLSGEVSERARERAKENRYSVIISAMNSIVTEGQITNEKLEQFKSFLQIKGDLVGVWKKPISDIICRNLFREFESWLPLELLHTRGERETFSTS